MYLIHRRRKCEGSSPNSLWPISYFGSIWELHVLDLKTNVFCRKKNQLHFHIDKGLTALIVWPKIPKMPQNMSAQFVCQAQKFRSFEKSSLWVSVVRELNRHHAIIAYCPDVYTVSKGLKNWILNLKRMLDDYTVI